jgi:hypothetical protein
MRWQRLLALSIRAVLALRYWLARKASRQAPSQVSSNPPTDFHDSALVPGRNGKGLFRMAVVTA